MLYLDSSALTKLVIEEAETEALRVFLDRRPEAGASSALATVEMARAVRRLRPSLLATLRRILDHFHLLAIDQTVIDLAGNLTAPDLRSLDAIHLASAISIREDVTALVTYDRRLATAAEQEGFEVLAPA